MIGKRKVLTIAYADDVDDVALVANDESKVKKMMNIASPSTHSARQLP